MAERKQPDRDLLRNGIHVQAGKLLVGATIVAIAATGALIIGSITVMTDASPPPGPNGVPPPPKIELIGTLTVLTGLFVLSWLAVVIMLCRDEILRRIGGMGIDSAETEQALGSLFDEMRRRTAEDRRADLAALEERIADLTGEYGEQRETDGYINGMRIAAAAAEDRGAQVRSIRRAIPNQ